MRALVTGAAGFVGSHLAEALLARGDDVVGVDCFVPYYDSAVKRANLAAQLASAHASFVDADLRVADIDALLDGVDVVFHQAGQAGVRHSWSDGFADYLGHNVLVTQRILEAVKERDRGCRVVSASSSSVYGHQERYPVTEEDLPRPYSPYGVTKLAAEHLGVLYADNWGVPFVALRYFTVYGPRQRPDMSLYRLCDAALRGSRFPRYGDGEQVREFTFVADIVAGNLAAADADLTPGTYMNLSGGSEITLNGLVAMVEELSESKIDIDAREAKAGDARRNGGATDHAAQLLGWKPAVTLRDGVAQQLAWHRALLEPK